MNQFTRNPDGTIQVPAGVIDVAAIFALGSTHNSVTKLVALVGEEQAILLGEYAEVLSRLSHPQLLGCLSEGWTSTRPLAPIVELLQKLDPCFTLRALLAQRLCSDYRDGFIHFSGTLTVSQLLPFYVTTSGLDGEALRLHALKTDTAPSDLANNQDDHRAHSNLFAQPR